MNVVLYKFTKRLNSTKQPNPAEGKYITCQLKDETSFLNPVLKISKDVVSGEFSPAVYNYVSIPYWQRYYYITDWQYLNGVWECTCSVDAMASFRAEIGNTSSYILRSDNQYDGSIIDNLYPAKTNTSITRVSCLSSWYGVSPTGGCFVVGIIGRTTLGRTGAVVYYALNNSQLTDLLNFMFSNQIYSGSSISEISEGLFKSIFNPAQYIVSCLWFPYPPETFGSGTTEIKIGYFFTGVNAIIVTALAQKTFVTATIPDHPQISRGKYLNHAPYTRLTLYVPPFGSIPIDTNFVDIGNYLYCPVLIDHITGIATLRVSISPDRAHLNETNVITERSSMFGVHIQISQVMPDYMSTISSMGQATTSALAGSISGGISSVVSAINSQMPKVSSIGANGSFIECINIPVLIAEHLRIADENRTEFGRPLCSTRVIKNIPGYIQCGEDDHSFSATQKESETINRYLKEGFFYE